MKETTMRIHSVLRLLCLLTVIILAQNATAYDFKVGGVYYNVLNFNECEVTRNGSNSYSGHVVIPVTAGDYRVVAIGESAFEGCLDLQEVTYSNYIKEIGDYAFSGCPMEYGSLENGIQYVGEGVFSGCRNLKEIFIGKSVRSIDGGFMAPSLQEISVDSSNKWFAYESGVLTDYGKKRLICVAPKAAYIRYPSSLESIGNCAFVGVEDELCELPESVKTIGKDAFWGSSFHNIVLGSNVKKVGEFAFGSLGENTTGLYIKAVTPPTASDILTTSDERKHLVLYVPTGSGEAYRNAKYWKSGFLRIEEFDPDTEPWSAVDEVSFDDDIDIQIGDYEITVSGVPAGTQIDLYDMNGLKAASTVSNGDSNRLNTPASGIYILSVNGKVKKIAIR